MRISTHVDVYEPSEYDYRLFIAKLDDMFLLASGRHICAGVTKTQTPKTQTSDPEKSEFSGSEFS